MRCLCRILGRERLLIANEIGLSSSDRVIDVGCDRGYFTIAAVKSSGFVVGVDLMNGFGRHSWWIHFNKAMRLLDLDNRVQGVRANAVKLPFKNSYFNIATAIHCIRSFQSINDIINAVREMKRVIVGNGYVVLMENISEARNKRQEIHLRLHSIRARVLCDKLDYFSEEELVETVNMAGFRDLEVKVVDYSLCSTPALFYVDVAKLRGKVEDNIINEYRRLMQLVRRIGEVSPPTIILKARK